MKRIIITGFTFLLLGLALGYFAARKHNEQRVNSEVARSSAAAIVRDIATLQCLTNGDTQQAETLLRSHMTIQGLFLEGALQELPPRLRDTNLVRIADRIRNPLVDQQE